MGKLKITRREAGMCHGEYKTSAILQLIHLAYYFAHYL